MAKYIDAGKLKYEIERRKLSNYYIDTDDYEAELFEIIEEQPEVNLENPVPNDLEEAANNYLDGVYGKMPHSDLHIAIFIAGAKWQKEQMLNEAVKVEGVALWQYLDKHGRDFYRVETNDFTTHGEICDGDKVKVIIVKDC